MSVKYPRRPKKRAAVRATDDTSVVIVSTLLEEDQRKSCEEIAHEANIFSLSLNQQSEY
jgi:hypothetical protein